MANESPSTNNMSNLWISGKQPLKLKTPNHTRVWDDADVPDGSLLLHMEC